MERHLSSHTEAKVAHHRATSRPTPRTGPAELAACAVLVALAGVHLLDLSDEFADAPFLGAAYVAVIAGLVASLGLLLVKHNRRGWLLAGSIALLTLVASILRRTTRLPAAIDDISHWNRTAGVCSMLAEGLVLAVAVYGYRRSRPR